jgi:hypothetical protein
MATSEKRVAANRQNAKKSTGPRSLDGKERARLNAVTHGLTAQTAVLPGEDPSELEALGKSLMRQLRPRGVVQRIIAERVVSLAWKLRRVARAEEAVAREMEEEALGRWQHERATNYVTNREIYRPRPCPEPRDGATLLAASWQSEQHTPGDERLLRLSEYELKLDGALRAAVRELLRLQKEADAFEDAVEEGPDVAEAAPAPVEDPPPSAEENEPNGTESGVTDMEEDPGSRRAAAAAGGQAPADKTNPIAEANAAAQPQDGQDVTSDPESESSAPAPGTSASPPQGPRR